MPNPSLLEPGEVFEKRVHRHWFMFFIRSFGLLIAAIAPYVIVSTPIFSSLLSTGTSSNEITGIFIFGYSLWLLFIWLGFFVFFTNYYLNVWIITNQRVISIEQKGLFVRATRTCFLNKIQDMEVKVDGVMASLLDFGDIDLRTAGTEEIPVHLESIPSPQSIKELIFKYQREFKPITENPE